MCGLNENLAPPRRYLRAQLGRSWNKVFKESCANVDRRNIVRQHIHRHIRDFIAVHAGVRNGQLADLADRWGELRASSAVSQELYVDPRTGSIRLKEGQRSWRHSAAERRRHEKA